MDAVKKVTGKSGMIAPKDNGTVHYVVTDSAGIKSADPVTYDDNGNVIPLSERFNPKKEDIRYRRSTPLEIHQSSVDEFVSKYNPDTEILVYPINEKTAKMFGYTLKQLKEKHGRYLPSYDFIAIFAREDIMDKQEIEETLFHESIHKIVQFSANEYMISAGKWMFDNASTEEILSDYKKKIEENYADRHDVVKHEEMLTHVLAGAMRHGGTEALMSIVPSDSQKIINEILNAIRYESKAESERRIRETLSQSAVAEDVSESSSEDARQSGRQGYAGTSGRPEDGESGRRVKSDIQNAAVDYLAGGERQRAIERAVNEEAAKLGVTVTYKTREEMPRGHKNDKGYYNTKTGEIVVCTENNASINDAIQTILHEAVAHKGLRQLMGDRFDEFINRVYESLDDKTKAKVDALADKHYKGNKAVAMEEYMATLAESEDFAKTSVWEKIKDIFNKIINEILNRDDIKIGDNELRYILRASYANMVNPRNMETIEGWAKDTRMREEYNINEASPEIMSRTGIDPTEIATTTAKEVYDRLVSEAWQEFQRQFQDAMQPVRIAIDAIQQETGNLPIEDYENFILIHNQASSRSRVQIDNFQRRYYNPIVKKVEEIIDMILEARGLDIKDKALRADVYKEIRQYMIAKHGLERNAYYQARKMRKIIVKEKEEREKSVREEYKEIVEQIKNDTTLTPRERNARLKEEKERKDDLIKQIQEAEEEYDMRDYSGLTALFGMEPDKFVEAEERAKRVIENFEATIGDDMTEQLWKKIHKATTKTLKHSYECGIISRQQFNEIKGMFQYYIPLRGFDETTAEDVYSYARFEGNRFNPAIAKADGRTSLADDPLAMIMNMAESEIAQGNKNRAKQALYNFILNRPIVDADGNQKQNTLMQIESVWYVKDADGTYHLATPDHASGETYEQFENRMLVLAETGEAMKSKKGQVDVGLRFQKPDNKNSHYIYLRVNGVEKAIYVNGDPKVANAVNGKSGEPLGEFGQKMKTVNRFLSSTFTNYSLEFTARNYFRDMLYSHINIDIKEPDPAYRKKFRQNWRHNNLRSMMKMLKAYRAGEYDVRGRALTEDEIAFVKFMENGGQTGYTLLNSVETHKRDLEKAIERMRDGIDKGGVKDSTVFKATLGGIELLNEVSELVTRFAAFKTSMDMGRSVVKSINDAKEITVNFNTKGAQDGSGWFGMLSRYFSCSKFFFNASVQGVQNVKAMAEANKLKFCVTSCGIIAFGFTMPIITAAIQELFGGDDDENEYWLIPEYERQNNFCVCLGNGKYVKIPLPIGFRELYAMGDMVAAMVFDKKFKRDYWQVGTDMANKIASMVLPINPLQSQANGLSIMETVAYTVAPSSAQVIIQTITNTDWKGAPLQKEYTYNANDPHWMKAYSNNPMWMRMLSKWCEEHINEGDYVGLNWSPEYLDNGLSNLFGGVYSLIKKTGNLISSAWNEEQRTLANVPLVSVVLGSGIDSDEKFINGAYYDEKEYYDKRIGKIKRHAEAFGYTLDEVFYKKKGELQPAMMKEIYNKRDFDFMQEYYKGHFGDPEGKTKEDRAGLNKLKREIDSLKKEINKDPSSDKLGKLIEMQNKYDSFRKDLVNDLLELD